MNCNIFEICKSSNSILGCDVNFLVSISLYLFHKTIQNLLSIEYIKLQSLEFTLNTDTSDCAFLRNAVCMFELK